MASPSHQVSQEEEPTSLSVNFVCSRTALTLQSDCHYIKQHLPDNLQGKVVVTNTTLQDVQDRQVGVKYLVTATPVLDGRSFGTNLMEAA
jgi:hypothetical protein